MGSYRVPENVLENFLRKLENNERGKGLVQGYEYMVVGSGAGGGTVGARLTEAGRWG